MSRIITSLPYFLNITLPSENFQSSFPGITQILLRNGGKYIGNFFDISGDVANINAEFLTNEECANAIYALIPIPYIKTIKAFLNDNEFYQYTNPNVQHHIPSEHEDDRKEGDDEIEEFMAFSNTSNFCSIS